MTGLRRNEAYTSKNEYVFGADMIVSPVVASGDKITGLAGESVWLPEGDWIEWQTGTRFQGPTTVQRKFSVSQIPIYVRGGAIVPEAPPMQYSNQKPLDPLIVNVFPLADGQRSAYTLYEDAGDSTAYQQGSDARTEIVATGSGDVLLVHIAAAKGNYHGMLAARAYEIRLPTDWPPALVMANGRTLTRTTQKGATGWHFEGNTLTTVIDLPSIPVKQAVTVRIARSAELFSRRAELDGFAGAMTRLREAYDELNQTWPIAWSTDELIDAMQTGDRLSYFPEHAGELLTHYREVLPKAMAGVNRFDRPPSQVELEALAKRFNIDPNSDVAQKKVAEFKDRVACAEAALADVRNPR